MTRRGEIYSVNWSPGRGSEQEGVRPSLVIQNDVGNQLSTTTIVAAITTRKGRVYPFHVRISASESGLPRDSIVKCEQVQTIDQGRLGGLSGVLSVGRMEQVDRTLRLSLGLGV